MKNQIIGFSIGILLTIVGAMELIPAWMDFQAGHSNHQAFIACSLTSFFFGIGLILSNYNYEKDLNIRQAFMLTTLSWLFLSFFCSLPFYFSDLELSFTDAIFESVSGITTTGSTVLSGLDEVSHGMLLWRSITQWIGGIGIIAFAIVILPSLRIGGMQLFQTESSDISDKAMPRTIDLVMSLIKVYLILTAACILVFFMLGMSFFDAVNHALTTIPTGGYSTHDASFGYFEGPALQYAAAFFMLAGATPFVLYVKFIFQGRANFWKDEQFRSLMLMLMAFIIVLTVWLWLNSDYSLLFSLRQSVFNIISVITTTGYATMDYTEWGSFAVAFFFFLTFLGGCAGSTAGGIKIMRLVVAMKIVGRQFKKLLYPHGVFTSYYQGKPIESGLAMAVISFLAVFVASNVLLSVLLTLCGLDFETAMSGAATALANVGPGIGDVIGPAGNFATLPATAKWILCLGMIMGRLEIMTLLVLIRPEYWQNLRVPMKV